MNYPKCLKTVQLLVPVITTLISTHNLSAAVAQTPPMGWNSFDYHGHLVTEAQVKAVADYMATNLKQYGWEYVCVDYCWYSTTQNGTLAQDANFNPRLNVDNNGRVIPDVTRFPSSANGKGFKPLADYVHGKGLKFGIHLMRGIPRQVVAANSPVLGTNYKAVDIHTKNDPCVWLNVMWPLNMNHAGAQPYLHSLFQQYVSWEVDFVKVDDLINPWGGPSAHNSEIQGYRKAIDSCGREMVFSTSPGPTPLPTASFSIATYANQWRMVNDFWDNWTALNEEFDRAAEWYQHASVGHWPDGDMIPIGTLYSGKSKFTTDEKYTLMTLFCIMRSPLIWGGRLVDNTPDDLKLMQNGEALAVNQNSINNKPVTTGNTPIWCADVPGTKIKYVAVFNRNSSSANVTINFSTLGVTSGPDTLRDLWAKSNVGVFSGSYTVTLAPHQSKLYRLTPPGEGMVPVVRPARSTARTLVNERRFETGMMNGEITIRSMDAGRKFSVSVFTTDGRFVMRINDRTGMATIPVGSKGVYMVTVGCNGGIEMGRVTAY